MKNSDLIISQIRQRLEILYQMVDELEESGGGGVTSYDMLTEKPKINGYTLSGDVSLNNIGAVSEDELATKQNTLTATQLSAVNSGINSTKVAQIATNTSNISEQETALDEDRAALVELVDSGAKNFIKNTTVSKTINGVEFIVNADKTVTANGTATGSASIAIYIDDANVIGKDMVVSGCPEGGSNTTFRCFLQKNQSNTFTTIATLTGNSVEFVSDIATYRYLITLYNGYTADNLVFSPMLCTKAAWDISHQYVPYRPSYDELVTRVEALEGGV